MECQMNGNHCTEKNRISGRSNLTKYNTKQKSRNKSNNKNNIKFIRLLFQLMENHMTVTNILETRALEEH